MDELLARAQEQAMKQGAVDRLYGICQHQVAVVEEQVVSSYDERDSDDLDIDDSGVWEWMMMA